MAESTNSRVQPRKLLSGGTVKVRIALASTIVLVIGAWLAPAATQSALSAPQEHAVPLLEEQGQLRETARPFVGVQEIAASVRHHSVAIVPPASSAVPGRNDYFESAGNSGSASGFGVFISNTHVLTHSAALDGRATVDVSMGGGITTSAQVVAYEPATGLVLLQVQPFPGRTSAIVAAASPAAGSLAVGVGLSGEHEVAVPVFITSVGREDYTVGTVTGVLLPGLPVFNLASELLAIVAPDGPAIRAIPVRPAAERMLIRAAAGERRSSFGLGFQSPAGGLEATFGNEGVVISDVLPGGPGEAAGIRVGDVVLAVGDVRIDSADAAGRAFGEAAIGAQTTLRVRRGARESEIEATPAFAYEIAALARSSLRLPEGPEARALFAADVLDASRMPPAARVVTVNGRTLTTRVQVQRELRAARQPVPVLLRHGNNQFFVAVEPAR
jgi:serine protease DegQ